MPITEGLPYSWYDTPNIHFFTLKDFQNLCSEMNIVIENSIGLTNTGKQFSIKEQILVRKQISIKKQISDTLKRSFLKKN